MALGSDDDFRLPQRIHVPKTSEIVADKIPAQIVRGETGEGDSLPPEGQLMESLGISRPTLREAFRILDAEGLISVVRGSRTGAKVHKPSVDLVSRYAGCVLARLEADVFPAIGHRPVAALKAADFIRIAKAIEARAGRCRFRTARTTACGCCRPMCVRKTGICAA